MVSFLKTLILGTTFCHVAVKVESNLPLEASTDTPWDDLKALLTSPDILTPGDFSQWTQQCVDIFNDVPGVDGTFAAISNYLILNQSSGLCLDHVSCAYEQCKWPPFADSFPFFPSDQSPYVTFGFNSSTLPEEGLLLPAMVLQPKSASDIVRAVEFCKQHKVGITVKVAGHSYFGASTGKNTLLIKMNPNYPKYAIGGNLTECASINTTTSSTPTANDMACALAVARGKNAVMRVGGGELFDEAYRAVSFDWNNNTANENLYHLVGGGAGTVSAAGGWMASGGLSGTTGMRLFGIGIDQVLALEMVLPSGQHVRLAPTEWSGGNPPFEYPKTLSVTGYCNANPYETDENLWEWTTCDENIDFNELWFAVRGGGGGTYGVLTSLHYQLHDYPGVMHVVSAETKNIPESDGWTDENAYVVTIAYIEFILTYLYKPEAMNVTELDSRGCNSAQTFSLNPFRGGLMFCYGNSGPTMVNKWREFITSPDIIALFQNVSLPEDIISALPNFLVDAATFDSYAQAALEEGIRNPGVPEGRLADAPLASLVPILGGFPNLVDGANTLFPLDVITVDTSGISQILALDVLTTGGGSIYAMGGSVPLADDGMNSLSPTRRNAAFMMAVGSEEIRNHYYNIFYGGLSNQGDFPGSSCHNHALVYEMGPLKSNWTQVCPMKWPQSEREEKCISQNEASWGTVNLARLEAFKTEIDPDNLFICTSGVGYSNPAKPEETGGSNTTEESGGSNTTEETGGSNTTEETGGSNTTEETGGSNTTEETGGTNTEESGGNNTEETSGSNSTTGGSNTTEGTTGGSSDKGVSETTSKGDQGAGFHFLRSLVLVGFVMAGTAMLH